LDAGTVNLLSRLAGRLELEEALRRLGGPDV
jgi:hypothetical protein